MSEKDPSIQNKAEALPIEVEPRLSEGSDLALLNQYLIEKGASAILIGGQAFFLVIGRDPVTAGHRKDIDALVIRSDEHIDHHETNFDLFVQDEDSAFKNRNGFPLGYHIHYVGENPLEPGLYLPPVEVMFLTEQEMATRRAVDRTVPGVLNQVSSAEVSGLQTLPLNEILLEFPGDFKWFGEVRFSFPIKMIVKTSPDGDRRTFLSFGDHDLDTLPPTAFPSSEHVRKPNLPALELGVLPASHLSESRHYELAMIWLKQGYVQKAFEYLVEHASDRLDSPLFVSELFRINDFPREVVLTFARWHKVAKESGFISLLSISQLGRALGFSALNPLEHLQHFGEKIAEMYGPSEARFSQYCLGMGEENLVSPEDEERLIQAHRNKLEVLARYFIPIKVFGGVANSGTQPFRGANGSRQEDLSSHKTEINEWDAGLKSGIEWEKVSLLAERLGLDEEEIFGGQYLKELYNQCPVDQGSLGRLEGLDTLNKTLAIRFVNHLIFSESNPEDRRAIFRSLPYNFQDIFYYRNLRKWSEARENPREGIPPKALIKEYVKLHVKFYEECRSQEGFKELAAEIYKVCNSRSTLQSFVEALEDRFNGELDEDLLNFFKSLAN